MDAVQNYLATMEPETRSRAYTWHGPRKPEQLLIRVTDDMKDEVFDSPCGSGGVDLGGEGWMEGGINEGKLDSQKDDMNMKKPNSRRNAWGCMSYADLIARAIESVPERRLTLSQIYDWMIQNVPYFRDKGESSSSAGWKNSIRHNLSLHRRFTRVQNEGTGKSSWWIINEEANTPMTKSPRRRTTSMDSRTFEKKRPRLKKKAGTDEINGNTGDKYNGVAGSTGGGEAFLEDGAGYQIANTLARHSTSSDGSPFCWPVAGDGLTDRFSSGDGVFTDCVYVGYSGLYQGVPDVGSATFSGSPDNIKPFYETSYATQLTPLHNLKYLDCQTTAAVGVDLNANDTLQFHNTTPLPPASILLPLTSPSGSTTHPQNTYQFDSLSTSADVLSDGNFLLDSPSYQSAGYSEAINSSLRIPSGSEVQYQSGSATANKGKGSVLRQMLSQGPTTSGGIFSSIGSGSEGHDAKYIQEKVDNAAGFSSSNCSSGEYGQYMKLEKMTPILECGEERQSDFSLEFRYDPAVTCPESISTGFSGCQEELGTNSSIYQYDFSPASFTNNYSHVGDVRNDVIGYDHSSSIQPQTAIGCSPDVYSNRLESKTLNSDGSCSDVMKSSTCKATLNQAVAGESSDQSSCLEMDYVNASQNTESTNSVDNESGKAEGSSDACPTAGQLRKENQGVKEEDCSPSCGVAEENWEFYFDLVPNSSTAISVSSPVTSTTATTCEADAAEATSALKVTALVETVATPTASSADVAAVT